MCMHARERGAVLNRLLVWSTIGLEMLTARFLVKMVEFIV